MATIAGSVSFLGNTYVEGRAPGQYNPGYAPLALNEMSNPDLVKLHNLVASNLGTSRVKRFADSKTAIRRTWGLLQDWAKQSDSEFEMGEAELAQQKVRQTERFEQVEAGDVMVAQPNPNLRSFQKEALEAIGQGDTITVGFKKDTGKALLSEQLIAAAVQAKVTAPAKAPRWARPKREEASKVAYRPKPGSVQAFMYGLLTQEEGCDMESFCFQMQRQGTKDQTLYTPSMVWSALRYLFVSLRGYGLAFDGVRLSLLVPKDERDAEVGKGK